LYLILFILVDYSVERKSILSSNKNSSKPELLSVDRKSNLSFNKNISKLDITNTPRQSTNNNSETPDDINDWALLYLETSYEQDHMNGKEFKYYKMIVNYY